MNKTLLAAAISGIMFGASGLAQAHEAKGAGFSADDIQQLDGDASKHTCKGQNDCKAKGGCKTDKNACKGENACKGQGGCKTDGTAKPEPKKTDKNGCGGASGCGSK